jgi:starch-binding outer membrane protein, SusD/RagB family
MYKFFNKIAMVSAVLLAGMFGLTSCEDYLDKSPLSDIDSGEAFKDFRNFQGFTEELYSSIPLTSGGDWHTSWNLGEDELWESNELRMLAYQIDQGNYWAWNTVLFSAFKTIGGNPQNNDRGEKARYYGLCWYGIRKANVGIANLGNLKEATEEQRNFIEGQLYFFRGWYHFMLMQYWGGLPYVDQVLPSDEPLRLPRLNYAQTAEKAAADFQRAADLLPVDWDQTATGTPTKGSNNKRINKVMALAYLGKNLLWAGSPLMNEESTGNATYNVDLCKRAADALGEALKICAETNRYELAPFTQYREIFYTYNQSGKIPGLKEAIFLENLTESTSRWRWNQVNDYRPMLINASGIKVYPTANYVNYYGMANGLPIPDAEQADAESGYDPEYPWKDRDPRFYNDIIFDGLMCTNTVNNGTSTAQRQRKYASLFTGGLYRTDTPNKAVRTGYMNKKFTDQLMNDNDGYKENNVMILSYMRLADVYLLYAEATAAGYGGALATSSSVGLSAADAVDAIRLRAGVGKVADKFKSDTEAFLGEVRRERAVELSFEGHRFVDLRRWKLLLQKPYTLKMSVEFDRADATNAFYTLTELQKRNARVLNLRHTVLHERNFGVRHYWFPFLQSDVNMYPELKQNPGW